MPWNQDGPNSPRIDSVLEHNSLWLMSVSKNALYNIIRSSLLLFFVFSFIYRTSYQCSWAAHFFAFSPWLWWCRGTWNHLNKTIRFFFLALLFPPNSRSKRTCGSECIQLPLLLLLSFSCWWQVHCRGAWPWWEALCNLHTKIFAMDSALERSWSCCAPVAYSVLLRGPRVSRLCCSASGTADIPSAQAANTLFTIQGSTS